MVLIFSGMRSRLTDMNIPGGFTIGPRRPLTPAFFNAHAPNRYFADCGKSRRVMLKKNSPGTPPRPGRGFESPRAANVPRRKSARTPRRHARKEVRRNNFHRVRRVPRLDDAVANRCWPLDQMIRRPGFEFGDYFSSPEHLGYLEVPSSVGETVIRLITSDLRYRLVLS